MPNGTHRKPKRSASPLRGCANVVIRDAYVTSDDYFSMLDACDCYVSLHGSEGFGLTVVEAMALGKPVISTAYSSTVEFANESNSFPVPARIVRLATTRTVSVPLALGRSRRRRLLDQNRRTRNAFAARDHTQTTAFARPVEVSIEPLQPSSVEPNGLFEAKATAVESLLGSPQPNLPSRMQRLMTPLRRLVLRCIRVYWVQQLAIDRALLAAMRTLRPESITETASTYLRPVIDNSLPIGSLRGEKRLRDAVADHALRLRRIGFRDIIVER